MTKKAVVVVVVVAALLVAGMYFWEPSAVPPGQEPLAVLSSQDFNEFSAAFDGNADVPRMVLLLSPT